MRAIRARWLFTVSATDANRTALRFARQITGRPKILVFSYSYHGGVDETFAVAGPGGATPGKPVGTVWFALAQRGHAALAELLQLSGDRAAVREQTLAHALRRLSASSP